MRFIMSSRLGYVIGAVAIVVVSFATTLAVLDQWLGPPPVTEETPASQLPKFGGSDIAWAAETGLNVQALNQTLAGSNQPIIHLIAVPSEGSHVLNGVVKGLNPGHTYRIKAWVRPTAGGNIQMQASADQKHFGAAGFDFAAGKIAFGSETGAGASPEANGWEQIWLDLPTLDGHFNVVFVVLHNSENLFKGDGELGVLLGGLTFVAIN
jgi:hypothetical protein